MSISNNPRKATKVSDIHIPHIGQTELSRAVTRKQTESWQKENREATDSSNRFVEHGGLPLNKYRMF